MRQIGIVFGFSLVLGGCLLGNISPEERLRDAVIELNDHARWHRIDLAAQMVDGTYQAKFRATHANWGKRIQMADTEIKRVTVNRKKSTAQSIVLVRWYDRQSMQVAESELVQDWKKSGRTFVLIDEALQSGHPAVLAKIPSDDVDQEQGWDYPDGYQPD